MATATSSTTPSTAIATSAATATSATTTSAATATSAATTSATSFTATCISSTDRTPVTSTTMSKALSQTSTVSSSVISPAERSLNDPLVELEGWVRLWENHNGIPPADLSWVMKDDTERGLFSPIQVYQNSASLFKRRRVMKSDRMLCYPREPPGYVSGSVPAVLCQPHTRGLHSRGSPAGPAGPDQSSCDAGYISKLNAVAVGNFGVI